MPQKYFGIGIVHLHVHQFSNWMNINQSKINNKTPQHGPVGNTFSQDATSEALINGLDFEDETRFQCTPLYLTGECFRECHIPCLRRTRTKS